MTQQRVYLIDDDAAVLDSMAAFFRTAGYSTVCFDNAEKFLASYDPAWQGCVVLDVNLPEKSGLELQQDFIARGIPMPVIFISAYGNISNVVKAMKGGAVDFLLKPLDMLKLREHVDAAFAENRTRQHNEGRKAGMRRLLGNLTAREREVLDHSLAGRTNKEIALALGISYRTVETHRAHILDKAGVKNIFELSRLFADTGTSTPSG